MGGPAVRLTFLIMAIFLIQDERRQKFSDRWHGRARSATPDGGTAGLPFVLSRHHQPPAVSDVWPGAARHQAGRPFLFRPQRIKSMSFAAVARQMGGTACTGRRPAGEGSGLYCRQDERRQKFSDRWHGDRLGVRRMEGRQASRSSYPATINRPPLRTLCLGHHGIRQGDPSCQSSFFCGYLPSPRACRFRPDRSLQLSGSRHSWGAARASKDSGTKLARV